LFAEPNACFAGWRKEKKIASNQCRLVKENLEERCLTGPRAAGEDSKQEESESDPAESAVSGASALGSR
jgi:hypothetical protein